MVWFVLFSHKHFAKTLLTATLSLIAAFDLVIDNGLVRLVLPQTFRKDFVDSDVVVDRGLLLQLLLLPRNDELVCANVAHGSGSASLAPVHVRRRAKRAKQGDEGRLRR